MNENAVSGVQSGGHTGGGTGSIRNLHSATGTDADRLPTSADSLRDQVPQLPQLQQAYAGLLGPQAGAVTHSGVGDSNSGKMKQQAAESSWSGGRVTSQVRFPRFPRTLLALNIRVYDCTYPSNNQISIVS